MSVISAESGINLPKPNYEYITTEESARRALDVIDRHDIISVDTEATALDPYEAKVSLVQIGIPNKAFVFDVRHDTNRSSVHADLLRPMLTNKNTLKILQNACYDMEILKTNYGFYIENIYDTMLTEQLFHLGLHAKASLDHLTRKYLGLSMDKQPRDTFVDYHQKFRPFQLEYAANDVLVLPEIRNCQIPIIKEHGFEDVCRLEFEFTKALCEMELNGIKLDVKKWRAIMGDTECERQAAEKAISDILAPLEDQISLFGVSLVDVDSPLQLKKALNKFGIKLENTSEAELKKYKGLEIIDAILKYRKHSKLITTYAEPLIAKINSVTGRLHTEFKQMVATGRMSSSRPNLQNIPKKQMYRSCFISEDGYKIITADMSGAELRILGNLSQDPTLIDSYRRGIDLHTKTASEVFNVSMENVTSEMRDSAKTINFGIIYGLTKFGLSRRLKISEPAAEKLINIYFEKYPGVRKYLDTAAREGVYKRYSRTISGRKRFYRLPDYADPTFRKIKGGIERQAKNAGIQGANADTIKQSMIYLVDRLEKDGYDAKLILTVHDELIVETKEDQVYEVGEVVVKSLIDGFGRYFSLIPMESEALIGNCWLKSECKKCEGAEMTTVPTDDKYGSKVMCKGCGGEI